MGFLRAAFALVEIRLLGRVVPAKLFHDKLQRIGLRLARDGDRVGSHVRNEADRAFFADFHAFIKLLRNAHRLVGRHSEPARRGLLERAGNERRRGIPLPGLLIEFGNDPVRGLQFIKNRVGQRLTSNPKLFTLNLMQLGQK